MVRVCIVMSLGKAGCNQFFQLYCPSQKGNGVPHLLAVRDTQAELPVAGFKKESVGACHQCEVELLPLGEKSR